MKTLAPFRVAVLLPLILCAGCLTRSISNSGYSRYGSSHDHGYRGELAELDVVGVAPDANVSDAEIADALRNTERPKLERNSRVLLIQSGAEFPDEAMVAALNRHFRVLPFNGRPREKPVDATSYSKALRLAAARGGYDKIVCVWGVLESEQKDQVTKAVAWVPIAGSFVPDERENMRIRLKAVIVDVASGRWSYVMPPPAESSALSARLWREETDQRLVTQLKETGYQSLARTLLEEHTS